MGPCASPPAGPTGETKQAPKQAPKQDAPKQEAKPPAKEAVAPKAGAKVYSMAEVAKHTAKDDCWFVVKGKVYNGTPFLEDHPGGAASILIVGGHDSRLKGKSSGSHPDSGLGTPPLR